MRLPRFGLLAAIASAVLALASPVFAQSSVGGRVSTSAPTYVNGETRPISLDTAGNLRVTGASSGSGATSDQVQGNVANDAASVGNPVLTGCIYNATAPTVDAVGDRVSCQATERGSIKVTLYDTGGTPATILGNTVDTVATSTSALSTQSLTYALGATTFERLRTLPGSATTGVGTLGFALAPHSSAGGALAPVATTVAASELIAKASAGNLYGWRVTTGGTAGYVLIFNATTAPADGTVTPLECVSVAANSSVGWTAGELPERYSTGIVLVFSSTGCFTKTASATAFIRARSL